MKQTRLGVPVVDSFFVVALYGCPLSTSSLSQVVSTRSNSYPAQVICPFISLGFNDVSHSRPEMRAFQLDTERKCWTPPYSIQVISCSLAQPCRAVRLFWSCSLAQVVAFPSAPVHKLAAETSGREASRRRRRRSQRFTHRLLSRSLARPHLSSLSHARPSACACITPQRRPTHSLV